MVRLVIALITATVISSGCQTVSEKQPTIAHTHIGHSLTAWKRTPGKVGLYPLAEDEARALADVVNAVSVTSSLPEMKVAMLDAVDIIEPPKPGAGKGKGFGLKRAFSEAMDHLEFAASSTAASANFRDSMPKITRIGTSIGDRIDLVALLANDVQTTNSAANGWPLVQEVQELSNAVLNGAEIDGKAPVGSSEGEYGLRQLRNEIAAMTAREQPAYVPVTEKWLFGLIRLSNGQWKFDFAEADQDGGGSY